MKKIVFDNKKPSNKAPFWQPWGWSGWLGKFLAFMLLLLLLLLLLSLFKKCSDDSIVADSSHDDDQSWVRPIDNAEDFGLPADEDNRLPETDDDDIITDPETGERLVGNQLYVVFDANTDEEGIKKFAVKFQELYPKPEHEIAYYNTNTKTCLLIVPQEKRDEICEKLPQQITEVKFLVTPVEVVTENAMPNDPAVRDRAKGWQFAPIQAPEAWDITMGSPDVVVAIVDSYFDLNHEELKSDRIVKPYQVRSQSSDVSPKGDGSTEMGKALRGHGSLVACCAIGNANNGKGTTGIAPKCKFMPVSVGSDLTTVYQIEGILYAIHNGANVINISAGIQLEGTPLQQMSIDDQIQASKELFMPQERVWEYIFNLANERNITIVWAAGNDHSFTGIDASKRDSTTIRVSAVDERLRKAEFTNVGNYPSKGVYECTISAPGNNIYGANPDEGYVSWPGTSFAAPIVTGAVALMKSVNPNLTNKQIIDILRSTGKPVQGAPEIGRLLQIKDALVKAKQI